MAEDAWSQVIHLQEVLTKSSFCNQRVRAARSLVKRSKSCRRNFPPPDHARTTRFAKRVPVLAFKSLFRLQNNSQTATCAVFLNFVPEERLELSRGCPRTILSRLRIPFRHSGNALECTIIHI